MCREDGARAAPSDVDTLTEPCRECFVPIHVVVLDVRFRDTDHEALRPLVRSGFRVAGRIMDDFMRARQTYGPHGIHIISEVPWTFLDDAASRRLLGTQVQTHPHYAATRRE